MRLQTPIIPERPKYWRAYDAKPIADAIGQYIAHLYHESRIDNLEFVFCGGNNIIIRHPDGSEEFERNASLVAMIRSYRTFYTLATEQA